jgi:hypothetical protein
MGVVVVLISVLATFLVRHWSTVIFVTRLVASGDPSALVQDLAALTRVLLAATCLRGARPKVRARVGSPS